MASPLAVSRGSVEGLLEPEPGLVGGPSVEERVDALEERVEALSRAVEELGDRFDGYNAALSIYESRISSLEQFMAAAGMVGSWKASTCRYQVDGVCTLWRLNREAAEKLGGDIVVFDEKGVGRVAVSKAPWFCALCPLYSRRTG